MEELTSANSILDLLNDVTDTIPRRDAELILSHILGIEIAQLYIYEQKVEPQVKDLFYQFVRQRNKGVPIQYVLRSAEFMGIDLLVCPGVFIPRPETELLVENTLVYMQILYENRQKKAYTPVYVLDLCCGCGNIAISLTKYFINCKIVASDLSLLALKVARFNAKRYGVSERVLFVQNNLFDGLGQAKFDVIVSNPPYISRYEFNDLPSEVLFEPTLALDGGKDGLDFYRRIFSCVDRYLNPGGYLLLELGYKGFSVLKDLVPTSFALKRIVSDYSGFERVVVLTYNG